MSYLVNAIGILIGLAFDAVAALFLLRTAAEACRADFRNPLSQFIYRSTNPVLAPLRRVLPNWRRINLAALVIAWLAMLLKRLILFALAGFLPHLLGLVVLAFAELIDYALLVYLVLVFAWSLMSLFTPDPNHPFQRFLGTLVEPLVRPLRGKLTIGMIDFSPTVVIIVLLLARMLISAPLLNLGMRLAVMG